MKIENVSRAVDEFMEKTPKSREFAKEAHKVMPGGVTANIKSFAPYPIIMEKAKGAYLYDIDGNEYIDYLLSYGALMLGHGHHQIIQAIQTQMEQNGTFLFGTPHELEIEMGKKIQHLYPSMEMVRYTNSGTEATLLAIRMAYAYTGKYKIAKFEGHYHGGYDQVLLSVNPPVNAAGPANEPKSIIESKGVDPYHEEHTIVLPFNNLEATAEILKKGKDEIAAVILEPIQGGFIPAEQSFMNGLRKITEDLGILLIFDEVKTGFRLGLGGAQSIYGIKPDITTLGKVVGGGFPVGIIGGKKEIMMVSAPTSSSDVFDSSQSKKSSAKDVLFHSGTYNGHPTILAAGLATIQVLEKEIYHVFEMTEKLKNGIMEVFSNKGIKVQTVGLGSIFNVVITEKEQILNYRDFQQSNFELRKNMDFYLLAEGIYTKPLNRYSIATVHRDKEINRTLEAYEKVISKCI
ncbi:aspartate aminotransferase family protein [Bacillus sp. DTU_2020_1000418_1_SI_GHA_SEK_038]|uniref:aspartate aminotransferase family protein n=1 Tax=Bacillus sp. DTU_2020_1000418_1_SI_GHA_SEK_038 TaxID=3077585 RepID=UPI0028E2D368|nr:aspartate aminotransferase family protein [Bacillus sp. DTU_2020_1000418_1_SI_GHA_SEK_038]WNS73714.1 aspartate aminotransferase family protein [Bacillus sp. DTU_2020_1000418_1_SI_GHA_SEK_038]